MDHFRTTFGENPVFPVFWPIALYRAPIEPLKSFKSWAPLEPEAPKDLQKVSPTLKKQKQIRKKVLERLQNDLHMIV